MPHQKGGCQVEDAGPGAGGVQGWGGQLLVALASVLVFMASTDSSASASARTSASSCNCLVSCVGVAIVAAVAAVAIAADGVGCIFLKGLTAFDQTILKVSNIFALWES